MRLYAIAAIVSGVWVCARAMMKISHFVNQLKGKSTAKDYIYLHQGTLFTPVRELFLKSTESALIHIAAHIEGPVATRKHVF